MGFIWDLLFIWDLSGIYPGFVGFIWDLCYLFGIYGIYPGFMGFILKVCGFFFSDLPLEIVHIGWRNSPTVNNCEGQQPHPAILTPT